MKRSEKKLYTIDNPKKSNLLTFFAFFCKNKNGTKSIKKEGEKV